MIDGKTLVTYNETAPFPVTLFGLATFDDGEVRYFFNCTSKSKNDVSNSKTDS